MFSPFPSRAPRFSDKHLCGYADTCLRARWIQGTLVFALASPSSLAESTRISIAPGCWAEPPSPRTATRITWRHSDDRSLSGAHNHA